MNASKFNYNSLNQLKEEVKKLGLEIPFSDEVEVLKDTVSINGKIVPNILAIHPMEGCDGTISGSPAELTYRRYERFAKGGAGLLWVEATAVAKEGRANPRQLYICEDTVEDFKKLNDLIINNHQEIYGKESRPYTVLQLTHSGRYSKPTGVPYPIIGAENEYLDKFLPEKYHVITDEEIENLEDAYVKAATLAKKAGYDAVDVKSCHRYLNSELLSGFTRKGKYGGSFENRTRFLLNVITKIKDKLGDSIEVTLRLNAFDAIPYPYGWGSDKDGSKEPDLTETIELVKILRDKGVKLINISCGNPYYNPHIGRPFDMGPYIANEEQLISEARMLNAIRKIQQSVPEITVIAVGFSWFREYAPFIAAGGIKEGWFKMAGFGRQAFAYPDFASDIIKTGKMNRSKCCIACSKCTEIMRDGGKAGCVIKDSEVYAPIYRAGRKGKPSAPSNRVDEHI